MGVENRNAINDGVIYFRHDCKSQLIFERFFWKKTTKGREREMLRVRDRE